MNKIYLIGNGYVSDYIVKHRIKNTKFIGVCRSDKNNCDENISIDVSKDNAKISELIASKHLCSISSTSTTNWYKGYNNKEFYC